VDAIVSLIRIMASTPHGSWKGCVHFGIREFFEDARRQPELPQQAIEEANRALSDLGIDNCRLVKITKEGQTDPDVDSYAITLAERSGSKRTVSLFR
jgi:hypothetical protein